MKAVLSELTTNLRRSLLASILQKQNAMRLVTESQIVALSTNSQQDKNQTNKTDHLNLPDAALSKKSFQDFPHVLLNILADLINRQVVGIGAERVFDLFGN